MHISGLTVFKPGEVTSCGLSIHWHTYVHKTNAYFSKFKYNIVFKLIWFSIVEIGVTYS